MWYHTVTLYAWTALADWTVIVVRSFADDAAVGVVIDVVLPATKGEVGAAGTLVGRRLPLAAQPLGFLHLRALGRVCRGRHPGAPAPRLALAGDKGGGA